MYVNFFVILNHVGIVLTLLPRLVDSMISVGVAGVWVKTYGLFMSQERLESMCIKAELTMRRPNAVRHSFSWGWVVEYHEKRMST
jgi:hypothetical protein